MTINKTVTSTGKLYCIHLYLKRVWIHFMAKINDLQKVSKQALYMYAMQSN